MPKATQLTVLCENRPGTLAQTAGILAKARVNILTMLTTTAGRDGYIGFIVDKPGKAKKALENAGMTCVEESVLHIQLPNVPGALANFSQKLAERNINITAGYQTTVKGARKASVVLSVSDLNKAVHVR